MNFLWRLIFLYVCERIYLAKKRGAKGVNPSQRKKGRGARKGVTIEPAPTRACALESSLTFLKKKITSNSPTPTMHRTFGAFMLLFSFQIILIKNVTSNVWTYAWSIKCEQKKNQLHNSRVNYETNYFNLTSWFDNVVTNDRLIKLNKSSRCLQAEFIIYFVISLRSILQMCVRIFQKLYAPKLNPNFF